MRAIANLTQKIPNLTLLKPETNLELDSDCHLELGPSIQLILSIRYKQKYPLYTHPLDMKVPESATLPTVRIKD